MPRRSPPRATVRWLAVAILIPTVPMLLASLGALLLFYLSPSRFGRLLAQLPGEQVIRSLLAFAPVALFAVVILAILYAVERPAAPAPARTAPAAAPARRTPAATALALGIPLLLLSSAAWLARVVAPGRFSQLLEPLPGTTVLQWLVSLAPPIFFLVVLLAGYRWLVDRSRVRRQMLPPAESPGRAAGGTAIPASLARVGAMLVLVPTVPLFLLSVAGLALYYLSSDHFASLVEKLSQPTLIRLGLVFTPLPLLALVLLAALTLVTGVGRAVSLRPDLPTGEVRPGGGADASIRQNVAVVVLVGGLLATVVAVLGLVGALAWLIVR